MKEMVGTYTRKTINSVEADIVKKEKPWKRDNDRVLGALFSEMRAHYKHAVLTPMKEIATLRWYPVRTHIQGNIEFRARYPPDN